MASPTCERAVQTALSGGSALLKYISKNDAGKTGSHQSGFYLPKSVHHLLTPHPPQKGVNSDHSVKINWQDGRITSSTVKWYGKSKDEYRLTGFGRGFQYRNPDRVGDMLVLVPFSLNELNAFVLEHDEDFDLIQAALGVEIIQGSGVYRRNGERLESENECVERHFNAFAVDLTRFPQGKVFSRQARQVLEACDRQFITLTPDDALIKSMTTEYQLFRQVERLLCRDEIERANSDIDDYLQTASSIMNRRKARAGRSLENHVEYLLKEAQIPHEMRPPIQGRPDIIIPSQAAYDDPDYPENKLFVVGVKTTCKDRWRQVLNEGLRIHLKHLITLQSGISRKQLEEMHTAGITLIVPKKLHKEYPKDREITLLSLDEFILEVRARLS